jgi:hypothetical protein
MTRGQKLGYLAVPARAFRVETFSSANPLSAAWMETPVSMSYDPDKSGRQAGRAGAMLFPLLSRTRLFILLIIGGITIALGETARPPSAFVYIISPKDGDTVTSPLRVQFGLSGMGVAPAGDDMPNTGHHHLLIDVNESLDPNEPIPQDKKHLHFDTGQTEAIIELPSGEHTLQLVLGDGSHHLFDPPLLSDVITVNVK